MAYALLQTHLNLIRLFMLNENVNNHGNILLVLSLYKS